MFYINIYKALQHLYLSIFSALVVLVDWFSTKTQFEEITNECLLINIGYINLCNGYFLIDIVLYLSRIQKYKSLSRWLAANVNNWFDCHLWMKGVLILCNVCRRLLQWRTDYKVWVIYIINTVFFWQMNLFVIQLYTVKHLDLLAPYWAEEIIQEFKKPNLWDPYFWIDHFANHWSCDAAFEKGEIL